MRRCLLLFLLCWPGLSAADPIQDWIASQPAEYHGFLERVYASDRLMAYTQTCPIDVFPRRGQRPKGTAPCEARPGWCLVQCRFGDGDACFGAAHFIDTTMEDAGDSDLSYPLYMAACADGNANGCVNAGATAKNGIWLKPRPASPSSRTCQYQTYETACTVGASWGCFMLGMEWAFEGVNGTFDQDKARAAWARACTLAPNGSACAASQRRLARD